MATTHRAKPPSNNPSDFRDKLSGLGLSRVGTNGVIDTTFGTRGNVVTSFPGFRSASAGSIAIQSNGDLVAGGTAAGSSMHASFALASYPARHDIWNEKAWLPPVLEFPILPRISGLAIQTDGKIVAAGSDNAGNLIVTR